jgi:cellulose synthase/poly-beta-1,6-N-acetylglucosamine synthase-like glycosyltransferase
MTILIVLSMIVLAVVLTCSLYLWALAIASVLPIQSPGKTGGQMKFAIAIPAHNEETVIKDTIATLLTQAYPRELFDVFVVADHCSDRTADEARRAGATSFERNEGERGGKASALSWLAEKIFQAGKSYDAVVVFDADTQVDPGFLKAMNARLQTGAMVVQGRHVISNPHSGWFPALTWAMMTIDNRFSNQGRMNLGLAAKHMGDSICFRSQVLKDLGWGSGLTEDYELRLRLICQSVRIQYEPEAAGYGQAPLNWSEARAQRLRWAKGMDDARKKYGRQLLKEGLRELSPLKLDGFLSLSVPSYSTLSIFSFALFALHWLISSGSSPGLVLTWGVTALLLFIYPLFGLLLERGPWWSYLAILSGPFFMIWRTWLNLIVRLPGKEVGWIRTPHHRQTENK